MGRKNRPCSGYDAGRQPPDFNGNDYGNGDIARSRDSAPADARGDRAGAHRPAAPELAPATPASIRWMACAIVLVAGATTMFAIAGESRGVVLAWIGGIATLFLSTTRHARLGRPRIAREEWPYLAGLAALLAIALITRVYKLSSLPYNLDGDFASVGLEARAFATGPGDIFAYGWAGIPALGYLPPALTMMLFGDGLTGLNASGVVEGLLVIIGAYLLRMERSSSRTRGTTAFSG